MAGNKSIEAFRGVAHPWLCDVMGHLTTRHYMAMFDDAGWHLLLALGFSATTMKRDRLGWADVRHEIEYTHEVPEGELVVVEASLERVGNKSLTYRLEMKNAETGTLCATLTGTTVRFHLDERKAVPLEPALREKAESWIC